MTNKMITSCAIYVRVSTLEQAREGYSVGEQEERLKNFCKAKNWTVYKIYTDPGFSGSNTDRPALKNMLKDIENKKINLVLVYKLDRLSRSQKDTLHLIEDIFLKQSIHFVSMNENLDTSTPYGRAMIGILSAFAQLEREQIRERTQMGLQARAKDGYYHGGGFAPIGYDYKDNRLMINNYEAEQIKMIVDMYINQKLPVNNIKNILNDKGYTRQGSKWTDTSIKSVLFTPLYTGVIKYKGAEYDGKHEAIYTEEVRRQILTEKKRRDVNKDPRQVNPFAKTSLLGGLLFCGNCGARYFTKQNTRPKGGGPALKYYTCYSRGKSSPKMIKDPNCKNTSWRTDRLDALILDQVKSLSFNHDLIKDIAQASNLTDTDQLLTSSQNRIAEIDKQLSRLTDLYATGIMDLQTIVDKITALKDEKQAIHARIIELEANIPQTQITLSEAENIADEITAAIDKAETNTLRELLMELIDRIEIHGDDIKIYWKFA